MAEDPLPVPWYRDPKIVAVLQVAVVTPVVDLILRTFKVHPDATLSSDISNWLVLTIVPVTAAAVVAGHAIWERIKAGRDPKNPAAPIAGGVTPAAVQKSIARATANRIRREHRS